MVDLYEQENSGRVECTVFISKIQKTSWLVFRSYWIQTEATKILILLLDTSILFCFLDVSMEKWYVNGTKKWFILIKEDAQDVKGTINQWPNHHIRLEEGGPSIHLHKPTHLPDPSRPIFHEISPIKFSRDLSPINESDEKL